MTHQPPADYRHYPARPAIVTPGKLRNYATIDKNTLVRLAEAQKAAEEARRHASIR